MPKVAWYVVYLDGGLGERAQQRVLDALEHREAEERVGHVHDRQRIRLAAASTITRRRG